MTTETDKFPSPITTSDRTGDEEDIFRTTAALAVAGLLGGRPDLIQAAKDYENSHRIGNALIGESALDGVVQEKG